MTLEEAKEEVLQAGYRLVRERLVARTWGNISCRVDEDHFVITPSGRSYEDLTPDDIVPVNIRTLEWTGPIKPSSEKGLHAEVYKLKQEIGMVIHTHQVNASVLAAARRNLPLINPEMERVIGKIVPCAPYALPGTKKLKKGTAQVLSASGSRAALLANHGAVCFGNNAEEAFLTARTLEKLCEEFIRREFRKNANGDRDDEERGVSIDETILQQIISAGEKEIFFGDRIICRSGRGFIIDSGTGIRKEAEAGDWQPFPEYAEGTDGRNPWGELAGLIFRKRKDAQFLCLSSRPYATALSKTALTVRPCLDDLAQIVGTSLRCAPSPENTRNRSKILKTMKGRSAVLLRGLGILAVSSTLDDAAAVCEIAEKSCKVFIESSYFGGSVRIPYWEALLMRVVYQKKYSSQNEKNRASL